MCQLKNTQDEYGLIARGFHWSMALLMLGLVGVGFWMTGLDANPFKFSIYGWHKSLGLLVLFLVVLRVSWRFINVSPVHLESHKPWERLLSKTIHIVLYLSIVGMPLTGWAMSSAAGYPSSFFGLFDMPMLVEKDKDLQELFRELHELFAFGLLGAVALHLAGALKHHVLDNDSTLRRMGGNMLVAGVFVFVFSAAVFFAVSAELGDVLQQFLISDQAVSESVE